MAQYRRSIFLINKKFQLRFCFIVCTWLLVLSVVYPTIIYNLFNFFIQYVEMDPMGPAVANLNATRKEMVILLVVFHALYIGVTFLLTVFLTHRVAGPLFKLSRFFQEAKDGNLRDDLFFRKGDYFKDLAEQYNQMMSAIKARANGGAAPSSASTHAIRSAIEEIERALPQTADSTRASLEAALSHLRNP